MKLALKEALRERVLHIWETSIRKKELEETFFRFLSELIQVDNENIEKQNKAIRDQFCPYYSDDSELIKIRAVLNTPINFNTYIFASFLPMYMPNDIIGIKMHDTRDMKEKAFLDVMYDLLGKYIEVTVADKSGHTHYALFEWENLYIAIQLHYSSDDAPD